MIAPSGWAVLAILSLYLLLFFAGTVQTARLSGQRIWLFGMARGRDRLAARGFRLAFVLALCGPLVWLAIPAPHRVDPLWRQNIPFLVAACGLLIAAAGAGLALAAQARMGASWRVGVTDRETGPLVAKGLFALSRNPTFLGQAMLLIGVALVLPSLPTLIAAIFFTLAARTQIQTEEQVLLARHGKVYAEYMTRTPRWIGRSGS